MSVKIWTGNATDGDWSNTANWKGGVLPISGDDVYIKNSVNSIYVNLDQNALNLDSLHILQSFRGQIGLFSESLKLDATDIFIGSSEDGQNTGPSFVALEFVNGNTTLDILNSAGFGSDFIGDEQTGQCVILTGLGSGTIDAKVRAGSLGVLIDADATGTLNDLYVSGGRAVTGAGVTITSMDLDGGIIHANFNIGTAVLKSGTFTQFAGDLTTLTIEDEGAFVAKGVGTITTINSKGGTASLLSKDLTVTDIIMSKGGLVDLDIDLMTLTNNIEIDSTSKILNMEF